MTKKKCYIYTRVSTAAQTEGYSLEAQQEKLHQYAEYKGLKIGIVYSNAILNYGTKMGIKDIIKVYNDKNS